MVKTIHISKSWRKFFWTLTMQISYQVTTIKKLKNPSTMMLDKLIGSLQDYEKPYMNGPRLRWKKYYKAN